MVAGSKGSGESMFLRFEGDPADLELSGLAVSISSKYLVPCSWILSEDVALLGSRGGACSESWSSSCCATKAFGPGNHVVVFSILHLVAGCRCAALEKSVWDEEDGTTRQWHTVNFFVFETRLQASVQPFIVGVVGCAHSWSAHVACCVCLCQVLGIEAQRCSNMASSDSEYKLHAKSWLLQIYQGIYWEYVSMLCSLFPWSAATTFGYVAFSRARINIGSKLAAIDGNQFLLLQAWCIIRVFEKCSIAVVQILRDCWPEMMCKLIILPVKTFSSGVSINLEVSMGPDEQNFLTCVCCTSLSLMDGNTVEDIVPLLFGLCHRRWTTAPSLLILRFNRGDFLCLSSVKVIQHLQLNTFKPQVHTPERPSGESPAGHQLVWSAKEALGDCKCSKFEPELSTDDRPLFDSVCSLRYLLCIFWPSSICYVQLTTAGPCSVVSFVRLYSDR